MANPKFKPLTRSNVNKLIGRNLFMLVVSGRHSYSGTLSDVNESGIVLTNGNNSHSLDFVAETAVPHRWFVQLELPRVGEGGLGQPSLGLGFELPKRTPEEVEEIRQARLNQPTKAVDGIAVYTGRDPNAY